MRILITSADLGDTPLPNPVPVTVEAGENGERVCLDVGDGKGGTLFRATLSRYTDYWVLGFLEQGSPFRQATVTRYDDGHFVYGEFDREGPPRG